MMTAITPEKMAENVEATKALMHPSGARTWPTSDPVEALDLQPGDVVRFLTGRNVFTVRSVTPNFVAMTGRSKKKPIYTVIDWAKGQRGPHDSWGFPMMDAEDTSAALAAMERTKTAWDEAAANPLAGKPGGPALPMAELELSIRRAVYLDIRSIHREGELIWPAAEALEENAA